LHTIEEKRLTLRTDCSKTVLTKTQQPFFSLRKIVCEELAHGPYTQ